MIKFISVTIMLIFLFMISKAQLIIPKYIHLPSDSNQSKQLITSLNGFLALTTISNAENTFVLKEDLPETSALLDEIKGMPDGNGPALKGFYKCYLTNAVQLDSGEFMIQFSYIGIQQMAPVLRASFKMIAKKGTEKYTFCSPLKINTVSWQIKIEDSFSFYFDKPFNFSKAKAYVNKSREFDTKFGTTSSYISRVYICDNLLKACNLLGVDYKSDYNGLNQDNLSSFENNVSLRLSGENGSNPSFLDLHDLWHERLHKVMPLSTINKPVDEGCAYLYGGSWGMSWPKIFKMFKAYTGKQADWLTIFKDNQNFAENKRNYLYASYVINALIVQKIEKKKGFGSVKELLACGKYQVGNENYFAALYRIIGIGKSNFNHEIQALVDRE